MLSLNRESRYVIDSDLKVIGTQLVGTHEWTVAYLKVNGLMSGYLVSTKRLMYHEPLVLHERDILEIEYLVGDDGTANILTEEII